MMLFITEGFAFTGNSYPRNLPFYDRNYPNKVKMGVGGRGGLRNKHGTNLESFVEQ